MKKATIICDPVASGPSVQFGLVNMILKILNDYDCIVVQSPFFPPDKEELSNEKGTLEIVSLSSRKRLLSALYNLFRGNEAMLWSISWLMEALFRANSSCYARSMNSSENGVLINLSYSVAVGSDILWNQATPPLVTLKMLGTSNYIARIFSLLGGKFISLIDRSLRNRLISQASRFVNNSNYLKDLYNGVRPSDAVVHVPREFKPFHKPAEEPTRDFVLAYIGKETEIQTLLDMAMEGVRIISFGAKIPYGTSLRQLKELTDFRGYVNESELIDLYYNAKFTVFPFTEEPFGWVPLESMYYGTPVLSYNKQGPSETVLDGTTGWLVNSPNELIAKALQLWNRESIEIDSLSCSKRAKEFSLDRIRKELTRVIEGVTRN